MAGINSRTVLMLHGDGTDGSTTVIDSSPVNGLVTCAGNAQLDSAQSYFGPTSLYFDGVGDYMTMPDSEAWNLGAGNFTIDMWWRLDVADLGVTNSIVGPYGAAGNLGWLFDYSLLSGGARFFWTTNGTSGGSVTWAWGPSTDTWYHLAVVRNSGDLYFFVNGTQTGSTGNISGVTIFNSTAVLGIGIYENGGTPINPMNGWIDELRIQKGEAVWTSAFTPPSAPYTMNKKIIGGQGVSIADNFSG